MIDLFIAEIYFVSYSLMSLETHKDCDHFILRWGELFAMENIRAFCCICNGHATSLVAPWTESMHFLHQKRSESSASSDHISTCREHFLQHLRTKRIGSLLICHSLKGIGDSLKPLFLRCACVIVTEADWYLEGWKQPYLCLITSNHYSNIVLISTRSI